MSGDGREDPLSPEAFGLDPVDTHRRSFEMGVEAARESSREEIEKLREWKVRASELIARVRDFRIDPDDPDLSSLPFGVIDYYSIDDLIGKRGDGEPSGGGPDIVWAASPALEAHLESIRLAAGSMLSWVEALLEGGIEWDGVAKRELGLHVKALRQRLAEGGGE